MKHSKIKIAEYLIFIGCIAAYLIFVSTKEIILNYPNYIKYSLLFCCFVFAVLLNFKSFKPILQEKKKKSLKWMFFLLQTVKCFMIAVFISALILIPFNYYNIHYAEKNKSEIFLCEIKGVLANVNQKSIYYSFNGEMQQYTRNRYIKHRDLLHQIQNNKEYTNYYFKIKVKKGLLDTYVMEDWDIIHK